MPEKVRFGIKNVHFGEFNVSTSGTVTLGTPYALPGAVNMTMEPESDLEEFYADDTVYWASYSDNGYTGELEMALFPDEFKTRFLGYAALTNGGIAHVKGKQPPACYIMFEGEGDTANRRGIVYNVALGQINREHSTTEDTKTPQTATLPFKVNGDPGTGIVKVGFPETAAAYSTMFTSPPVPALPTT